MFTGQIAFCFLKKNRKWAAAISLHGSRETFAMVDGRMVDGYADGRGWRRYRGRDFTPPVPETFAMVDGRMVDAAAWAVDGRTDALLAQGLAGRITPSIITS